MLAVGSRGASAQEPPPPAPEVTTTEIPPGPTDYRFEVGVYGGGHFFAKDHGLGRNVDDPEDISPDHGSAFGLRLTFNFNRWLEVSTNGNQPIASLYERRFRPEFVPAFRSWQAQDPLNNPNAIASPLNMPEYKLANAVKADTLERLGNLRFEQGKEATDQLPSTGFLLGRRRGGDDQLHNAGDEPGQGDDGRHDQGQHR